MRSRGSDLAIPASWTRSGASPSRREERDLDLYRQTLVEASIEEIGRIYIGWGAGTRSWVQIAANQAKPILEVTRVFQEEAFPGYTAFIGDLSMIETLPAGWLTALRAARGVYLLTCPRTREQYVGSAYGEDGFFGRWTGYARDGHGGNVGLKSRDPSDYQVSILEVCGSTMTSDEIFRSEQLWKAKLQSREMGLNRN
ncbi:MAG TPA: GIY-YIG nuclease family protein [Sphingobium sp.]